MAGGGSHVDARSRWARVSPWFRGSTVDRSQSDDAPAVTKALRHPSSGTRFAPDRTRTRVAGSAGYR